MLRSEVPAADISVLMQSAVRHSENLLKVESADDNRKRPRLRFETSLDDGSTFGVEAEALPVPAPAVDPGPAPAPHAAADPVDPDPAESGPPVWHLGGSLLIPGLKHICSNVQGDVLARLDHFKDFQERGKGDEGMSSRLCEQLSVSLGWSRSGVVDVCILRPCQRRRQP